MLRLHFAKLAVVAFATLLACGAAATAGPSDKRSGPTSDEIRAWVAQLGSERYEVREAATERLIDAGRLVILELETAAKGDDPEVSARAIAVLGASLRSEDDLTEDAAVDSLSRLADTRVSASAELAAATLGKIQGARRDRAIAALQRLGATVLQPNENDPNQFGYVGAGLFSGPQVSFGPKWRGDRAKLALLRRIPDLQRLSFYSVTLTEDDLPNLIGFSELRQLDLFGSKLSKQATDRVVAAYPKATVNIHTGAAKLGVAASSATPDHICLISGVEPHSAAEDAGLQAGDIILKFGGQPVTDFKSLTELIGSRQAGEKVLIEARRNSETFTKTVTLGEWK